MWLLSVVTLCVVSFLDLATADLLGNQTVRDILLRNRCLCPCGTTSDGTKSFLIPFEEGTWFEGASYCNSVGMSMVEIRDRYDNEDLQDWLQYNGDGPSESYWIGANDLAKHGLYHWGLSNKQVRFKQWASGEPNSAVIRGEKEHCVELRAETMQWNDSACSKRLKVICERFN